jgi:hypothetical protein
MLDTIDLRISPEMVQAMPLREDLHVRSASLRKGFGLKTLQVKKVGDGSIIISFSIPQALFGSSVEEYRPADSGMLNTYVQGLLEALGIEVVDTEKLSVCRLDICRNLDLGRPVSDFIVHAGRYSPKRVTVIRVDASSVTFRWSKARSLTLYDKMRKEDRRTGGCLLRIELQLKRGVLIRSILGISTFGDVLRLRENLIDTTLASFLESVFNTPDIPASPDAAGLWEAAALRRKRGVAPLFTSFFLSNIAQPKPSDLLAMKEQMRSRLSPKTYFSEKAAILDPVAAILMDSVFKREILDRLRRKSGDAA